MKFTIAVMMLAMSLGAQSSVIPLVYHSPLLIQHAHWPAAFDVHSPAAIEVHPPTAIDVHSPAIIEVHPPAAVEEHTIPAEEESKPAAVEVHSPAEEEVHSTAAVEVDSPAAVEAHAAPVHLISHPPVVGAAPIVLPAPEGTYVAKTLGAVHVAPLPGHAQSAASVNLEPAPGTI